MSTTIDHEIKQALLSPRPCHWKTRRGYCGKPSNPVSNYCAKHGQMILARFARQDAARAAKRGTRL